MDTEIQSQTSQRNQGKSFLRLVVVLFAAILLTVVAVSSLGDSQGTQDFNYAGFG